MKKFMSGFALSLGLMTSQAQADQVVIVDGETYFLSHLTENCQSITGDPAAQIACFGALSQLLADQEVAPERDEAAIAEALGALQAAAAVEADDTGLMISGSGCTLNVTYFGNYFHISRRNVSEIDLFHASFDVSALQLDQSVNAPGSQPPLSRGVMQGDAVAVVGGAAALDSSLDNFAPRPPSATLAAYAMEVAQQIPATEAQTFDFALVHPMRSQQSADIWAAFEAYVTECQR